LGVFGCGSLLWLWRGVFKLWDIYGAGEYSFCLFLLRSFLALGACRKMYCCIFCLLFLAAAGYPYCDI